MALIGAALLVAGGWIAHLYGKLELQEARYETRIADMAREVSEKEKARAEAVAAARERMGAEDALFVGGSTFIVADFLVSEKIL